MKVPDQIQRALYAADLPYTIAVGRLHWHIRVCDRLVGILPRGTKADSNIRASKNVASQIKRFAREYHQK